MLTIPIQIISDTICIVKMTRANDERRSADMDFMEFNIGKNQAEEFAKAIFADIEAYVNEHLEEYEEFLKEYESEVKENGKVKKVS